MILTKEEREKFAHWLRIRVDSNRGIVEQMNLIPAIDAIKDHYLAEAAACEFVARLLESIEDAGISR